tara:strand:+ start:6095 stop:7444 length:1350 start_codon:yes stop_codon:yes gene_type:complete
MSEGTKLGEKQDNELGLNEVNSGEKESLEATKIGDISDFEKSLFESEVKKESSTKKAPEAKKEAPKEVAPKNELELLLEKEMEKPIFDYQEGDLINATVRLVEKAGVIIDFNYKSDGYIPNAELGFNEDNDIEKLKVGDSVKVFIEKLETKDGYSLLSRKKAQFEESWDELVDAYEDKESVSIVIVSKVMGGLVTTYKGIRGFVPASQILLDEGQDMETLVGKSIEASVIQADRRRRKVIFSNKNKSKGNSAASEKFIEEIEVGQTRAGKVTSIKDFGVFVDIGGIEGLVHISELSWLRVSHPTDIVAVGDEVTVFILGVDKKHKKISLGMKQLEPDPWVSVGNNYAVGQVVEGTISRIVSFGAFIKLEKQLEGLIHISEMSADRIEKVEDVVKPGDKVKAKIIKLLIEDQKIGLTLKDLDEEKSQDDEVEATKEESVQSESTESTEDK